MSSKDREQVHATFGRFITRVAYGRERLALSSHLARSSPRALRPQPLRTQVKQVLMGALLSLPLVGFASPFGGATRAWLGRAPSSIRQEATKQKVVVSYLSRSVRECRPSPGPRAKTCTPVLSDSAASTEVQFELVARPGGAAGLRERVRVAFPEAKGLQRRTVELAIGEWIVAWPAYRQLGRLTTKGDGRRVPEVLLRSTSGACELVVDRCHLNVEASSHQLRVAD